MGLKSKDKKKKLGDAKKKEGGGVDAEEMRAISRGTGMRAARRAAPMTNRLAIARGRRG